MDIYLKLVVRVIVERGDPRDGEAAVRLNAGNGRDLGAGTR